MSGAGTRALALDYGEARIGVAISDELGLLAHPRPFVPARPPEQALQKLRALIEAEGIEAILVGLPLHLDGREGPSAVRARKFAAALERVTGIAPLLVDERLTTREAMGRLREGGVTSKQAKGRIDSAAAAVLLQAWLDGRPRA